MARSHAPLTADASAGRFHKESVTLLAPDGQANVIISSEPLDPTLTTAQYAEIQGDPLAREFPGYRQLPYEPCVVFSQFLGMVRDFSWTPPDGHPVTQIQCCATQNGRGHTGTATTQSRWFADREDVLRLTLLSAGIAQ